MSVIGAAITVKIVIIYIAKSAGVDQWVIVCYFRLYSYTLPYDSVKSTNYVEISFYLDYYDLKIIIIRSIAIYNIVNLKNKFSKQNIRK